MSKELAGAVHWQIRIRTTVSSQSHNVDPLNTWEEIIIGEGMRELVRQKGVSALVRVENPEDSGGVSLGLSEASVLLHGPTGMWRGENRTARKQVCADIERMKHDN